jgi:tetratricopeptide (TPR) repeat protein
VRASFGDTLSVEEGEGDEAYTVPAISPETAATLERIRLAYDQLSTVAGADERYRQEAAKADLRIGEVHLRLDRYAEARQAFERAIGLFEQSKSTGSQDQPQTRLQLAELYNGLGEAARGLNDREFSRQQHERAVQLLETNPGLPEIRFELARTHYLMGKRSFSLGGFPGFSPGGRRRPTGGSPTEGRSEMAAAPTDPRPPRDGERLGEESRSGGGRRGGPGPGGERSSGRPGPGRSSENEREHLQTAVDLLNGLVSEFPDVAKYHFLMAQCHLEFTHGFRENRELAAGHRLAAIDILETLIQMMPDNPDYLHQLGVAYERRYVEWNPLIWIPRSLQPLLLDASAESSDRDGTSLPSAADVEQDMLLSVMYSGELIRKQPRVPASMMSHILGLSRLADVQAYQHKDIQAEQSLREALRLLDEAVTRFPEQALLGAIRRNRIELFLGKLLVDRQEYAEARDLLEPLVERIDLTAGSSSPGTPPAPHDARFMAYHLLASVLENLGETEAAERNASRADRARSEWRDMIRGFSRPR